MTYRARCDGRRSSRAVRNAAAPYEAAWAFACLNAPADGAWYRATVPVRLPGRPRQHGRKVKHGTFSVFVRRVAPIPDDAARDLERAFIGGHDRMLGPMVFVHHGNSSAPADGAHTLVVGTQVSL